MGQLKRNHRMLAVGRAGLWRRVLFVWAGCLLVGAPAALGQVVDFAGPQEPAVKPADIHGTEDLAAINPPKPAESLPSERYGLRGFTPSAVALDEVSAERWAELQSEDAIRATVDKVVRYGFARPVSLDSGRSSNWIGLDGDAYLWMADVVVPGAIGVRLHFTDLDMPGDVQLFVYSPDHLERVWGPYESTGPSGTGELWTPTTFGERARIECFVPGPDPAGRGAAISPEALFEPMFKINECQHIYRDPIGEGLVREGTCHNDVTCYSAWANTARASAGIGTINSDALFCSGTMITTTSADQTPYWLTANHCISSASTATNSEIYWLFQTSTCNGTPPSISTVPQSAVCTRLSYSSTSDYSLLMVEGKVPDGLYWAGWTSATVANGTDVTCIHHPDGAYKRISFATKTSGAATNFIRADWYDAPTEPGSSGSGLFRSDTQQLVGQLYGGPSSCADESYDDYGAFATTYGSISSYLSAGSDDSYENNDTCAAARSMTAGTYSSLIVKRYASGDEDWYAVSVPAGQTLTLTLNFTHANGDVDLQLYSACGGAVIASSTGSTNSETVTYKNSGGSTATYYSGCCCWLWC